MLLFLDLFNIVSQLPLTSLKVFHPPLAPSQLIFQLTDHLLFMLLEMDQKLDDRLLLTLLFLADCLLFVQGVHLLLQSLDC